MDYHTLLSRHSQAFLYYTHLENENIKTLNNESWLSLAEALHQAQGISSDYHYADNEMIIVVFLS